MQEQEKKFLGGILYVGMLLICFTSGVIYQSFYQPIPVVPEVIEVPTLIEVPNIIETTKVIEVEKECKPLVVEEKQGWFK